MPLAAPLQLEPGQVNLLFPSAHSVCAPLLVAPVAHAVIPHILQNLDGVLHIVLLHSEPKRWQLFTPCPIGSADYLANAVSGKVVVREVDFLDGRTLLHQVREALGALIIDIVFEKLQDPKLLTTVAEVEDHS